jgi:C-terminal processing protease CtpA/Prc
MTRTYFRHTFNFLLAFACCLLLGQHSVRAQGITSLDRERAQVMLSEIKDSIKKNYYDAEFHGINIDERFKAADEMIKKATSLGQAFGIIAQAVMSLNDSHTTFSPPEQTVTAQYGWLMQSFGESILVTAVKPGSDAETKGLHPGDAILAINGVQPTRNDLWKITYLYYTLRPQAGMHLLLRSPDGKQREMDVLAKVQTSKRMLDFTEGGDIWHVIRDIEKEDRLNRHRSFELPEVFVWKMPAFDILNDKVDSIMEKAKKHDAVVFDLRGNPGGYEDTLLHLVGSVFDKDITVGNAKSRKETKAIVAKTLGAKSFKGKIFVIVDSSSGSAAELFARTVQLEKRGVVIGDRTAGAVMRSRYHSYRMGRDIAVFYGASITEADFLMPDGPSLEHVGVIPDLVMVPTPADLSRKLDPVLAYAIKLAGAKLDPEKAGALFPIEWK